MTDRTAPTSFLRTCVIAARLFAIPASIVPVLLGVALSYHLGHPVRWPALALTLVGMMAFHTASNLINDCYDHRRGIDRQVYPSSGAVVRGLLTEQQALRAGWGCVAFGALCGFVLVGLAGPVVLLLGVLGVALIATYTTERFCLKYTGLGDLAIFCAFGVLPVFGTYWVQTQSFSCQPIAWSVPLVLVTVAILHANNWRDMETDRSKGCRTLAGLLGESGSRHYYRLLVLLPFALTVSFVLLRTLAGFQMVAPFSTLAVLLVLPAAIKLTAVDRIATPEAFMALDGATAQLQLKFGLLLAVSLAVARHLPGSW